MGRIARHYFSWLTGRCCGRLPLLASLGLAFAAERRYVSRKKCMATQADIQALVDQVDRIWSNPPARNGAFGNVLRAIGIKGIRGLDATVEFTWPVTAIAGTNGSGKTTFLQVASAAYVGKSGGRQVKLGSWIRGALQGDTPPIRADASILYDFADTPHRSRSTTSLSEPAGDIQGAETQFVTFSSSESLSSLRAWRRRTVFTTRAATSRFSTR